MSEAPYVKQNSWVTGSPWRDMRAHATIQSGIGMRVVSIHDVKVMHGSPEWALSAEGFAAFYAPITREELKRLPGDSAGIKFESHFRYGQPWLKITCLDRELESVFLRFCESFLEALAAGSGTADALIEVLHRFRRLFEENSAGVSAEKIAGLFAELVVLDWLIDSGVDAVPCWLGPTKETHDFVIGKAHLEVKALSASGEKKIRVSNLYQLDKGEEEYLFLLGVRLAPGVETIGNIVERIRGKLLYTHHQAFEKALMAVGCLLPVSDSWNRKKFSHNTPAAWRIEPGFPRLVPSMLQGGTLPAGVSSVKYSVSLDHAHAYTVELSDLLSYIPISDKE